MGTLHFLSQLKGYSRGNILMWCHVSIVILNICLHNKEKLFSILQNQQTNLIRINLPKMDRHTWGRWLITARITTRTTSHKVLITPADYPSMEWIPDKMEFHGYETIQSSMFRKGPRKTNPWQVCNPNPRGCHGSTPHALAINALHVKNVKNHIGS